MQDIQESIGDMDTQDFTGLKEIFTTYPDSVTDIELAVLLSAIKAWITS